MTDPRDGQPEPPDETVAPADPMRLARELAQGYRTDEAGKPVRRRRRGPAASPARRADRDDAVPLASALGDLVSQQGWTDQLAASRVFTDWASVVGPDIAQHSRVEGFADQVVVVRTDSTAWRKELQLLAPRVVARLNEELGQGSVLRIDVRGPDAPSWNHGRRTVRGGRGPRDTYG
jgi:predicted nucleic acid-binding Zn ribbon protein